MGILFVSINTAACDADKAPASSSRPVSTSLPQLPRLPDAMREVVAPDVALTFLGDSARLTISVEPGARVNALLPPVIESTDGRRFILRAPTVTEDSAYFVEQASVTLPRSALPIRGTLRTSFCRSDERLCRSAQRDVLLENRER